MQAMTVPDTQLVPKKRKDQILLEKMMLNLEPASPMKPNEKAVTMIMPKRKSFVPKNRAETQENTDSL